MIDIIIATYDRTRWLEEAIVSMRASFALQSAPVRIIVVDDASPTTEAEAVAKRHGCDYIRHERNTGVAQTLVTGWEASTAPYTSFWGDDDIMLPNWASANVAKARDGWDVISNSYRLVDAMLEPIATKILPPVTLSDLRMNIVAANDGSLIRREALEGIRWRPERGRAMMLTMWLALATAGRRFTTINDPTWLYRRHDHNLSGGFGQPVDPAFMALRREAIAEYAQ